MKPQKNANPLTIVISILLGFWIGYKIDTYLHMTPIFTLLFSIVFIILAVKKFIDESKKL